MIEAYAISVAAKLEDGITPGLLKIIDSLNIANKAALDLVNSIRALSTSGLAVARNLEKAAAGATALGDAAGGLTRASYVLDTMAASSADVARNLAAARAEGAGMGGGGSGGGGGSKPHSGSSAAGTGAKAAALGVTAAALGGVYEYQKLQDAVTRGAARQGMPQAMIDGAVNAASDQVMGWYKQYGSIASGGPQDFAAAYVAGESIAGFLPTDKERMDFMNAAAPWAAQESKQKGVSFSEAMKAFMEGAHQAGAQSATDFAKFAPALYVASVKSDDPLSKIVKASGYALPQLTAAGFDPDEAVAAQVILGNAGISSTKKGTWVSAFGLNINPKMFAASGFVKNTERNKALQQLGIIDAKGHSLVDDEHGHPEMLKILGALNKAKGRLDKKNPMLFQSDLQMAFLQQGSRAADILKSKNNLIMLAQAIDQMHAYGKAAQEAERQELAGTQKSKAEQTVTNLTVMSMSVGKFLAPATDAALSSASGITGWMAANPGMGTAAAAGGLFGTAMLAKGFLWPATKAGMAFAEKAMGDVIVGAFERLTGAELAEGVIATMAGETVAVGLLATAIIGGVAYLTQAALHKAWDLIPTPKPGAGFDAHGIKGLPGHGDTGVTDHAGMHQIHTAHGYIWTPNAPPAASLTVNLNHTTNLDGKAVANSVSKFMVPANQTGSTDFNPSVMKFSPGMGSAGGF